MEKVGQEAGVLNGVRDQNTLRARRSPGSAHRTVRKAANQPTDCLQAASKEKARHVLDSRLSLLCLGWLMGLEPNFAKNLWKPA